MSNINYTTSENQQVIDRFVQREVVMRANQVMEALQSSNPDMDFLLESSVNFEPVNENNEVDYDNGEYPEIYEYYFVTDFLAEQLEAKGEIIIKDYLDLPVWGRTTTGQSISLDVVIGEICEDQGLLN